jgi:hypothetical protein
VVATTTFEMMSDVVVDELHQVLYVVGGNGTAPGILRCELSTECDSGDDYIYATSTGSLDLISVTLDERNGVLYAGTSGGTGNGLVIRCVLTTGCNDGSDFTVATSTGKYISHMVIDYASSTLYIDGDALLFRCALSTDCDSGTDFTVATNTGSTGEITGLSLDTTNGTLYVATTQTTVTGSVIRCVIATGCDSSTDFTVATSTIRINGIGIDNKNGYLFASGQFTSGNAYVHCVLSSGCDSVTDFTFFNTTSSIGEFRSFAMDEDNNMIYVGYEGVYRCRLETACDSATEYTSVASLWGTVASLYVNDQTSDLYVTDQTSYVYHCRYCVASNEHIVSMNDLVIEEGASLTNELDTYIAGDYTNNGTSTYSTVSTSTVIFSGSSDQTISGQSHCYFNVASCYVCRFWYEDIYYKCINNRRCRHKFWKYRYCPIRPYIRSKL